MFSNPLDYRCICSGTAITAREQAAMNVLIDWGDGLPEKPHRNIERVEMISDGRPLSREMPEPGVLYVNPSRVRSVLVEDDHETTGDKLVSILVMVDDRAEGETLPDLLRRILQERKEAREPVPA